VVTESPEVPLVGLGEKIPVLPVGNPLALRLTVPAKPFIGMIVTPKLVALPCKTVCTEGELLTAKSGSGEVTNRVTVDVWVSDPLTPVIIRGKDPVGVVANVVTAKLEVPVAGSGVNVPVAPLGNPVALKLTVPPNPFIGKIVTP
jgi:hypothetical protein